MVIDGRGLTFIFHLMGGGLIRRGGGLNRGRGLNRGNTVCDIVYLWIKATRRVKLVDVASRL